MPKQQTIAPVYRYFTADLLTNEILAEIPLRGVSFECALKAAGKFSGRIPITAETDSMDLRNSTMPGNTALYVVRNGKCVWGGIIWGRGYQLTTKDLAISASEFPSYFYHRKIWKTWNHQYGATVSHLSADDAITQWVETRRNLHTNPRVAVNVVGYGTSIAGSGAASGLTRATSAAILDTDITSYVMALASAAGTSYIDVRTDVPVSAGQNYSFSGYINTTMIGTGATCYVQWLDASSAVISTVTNPQPTYWPKLAWTRVTAATDVTAPAGAVTATVIWRMHAPTIAPGHGVFLTGVLAENAANVGTFFDANTVDTSTAIYNWAGSSNASSSILLTAMSEPVGWSVTFDNGSHVSVKPGSTVKIEYYEPEDMKYSGYYRVLEVPAPTTDKFFIVGGPDVADIVSTQFQGTWLHMYTKENHGYTTGDSITVSLTSEDGVPYSEPQIAEWVVDAPDGPDSAWFRVGGGFPQFNGERVVMEGLAYRALPEGTYIDATVTVRQDTFDYIRTLIDAMFEDFVTTDFPNVYIEPGISYAFNVVSKQAINGFAIIETEVPHGIAPGQAIQIQDVGGSFDGEFEVTDTPADNVIVYAAGGTTPLQSVSAIDRVVTTVKMDKGLATLTTSVAHGFTPGQTVAVNIGNDYSTFNGEWTILDTPTSTTFRYNTESVLSYANTVLPVATTTVAGDPVNGVLRAGVNGNSVTLELADPVVYSAGDTVTVAQTDRNLAILEKSLDGPNSVATIQTKEDHGLSVGDTVILSGLADINDIVSKSTTTTSVTMTTARPHNLRVGQDISIQGLDEHKITGKALVSNVATLTTSLPHNIVVGKEITVSNLYDTVGIANRRILDGNVRLTTTFAHNIQVNDSITVSGISDTYAVVSKEATDGTVILTTAIPHNIQVGSNITVSGVGIPFDGTKITVDSVTSTRIVYKVDQSYWDEQRETAARNGQTLVVPLNVPSAKSSGSIVVADSYYNGTYTVNARTDTTVEYFRGGNDLPIMFTNGASHYINARSTLNGTYTVTARTATTLSYAKTGNHSNFASVPQPTKEDEPQPIISLPTIHSSSGVISAVTANTFTLPETLLSAVTQPVSLTARRASIFNGTRTITSVPTTDRFTFTLAGYVASVLEQTTDTPAFVRATGLYNGTYTITNVNSDLNTISYARTLANYGSKAIQSQGNALVSPVAIVSTFGPFPGNADIGMTYATQRYTGINVEPTAYRGFELKSVGEALDAYSDNINGFEYRVDCDYDVENDRFTRTFVLIPINFPNPPPPGTVAPLSRYGADKLVFEFPGGNIRNVAMDESAENSATRFFALGETDLDGDVGPNIGIASSEELLRGKDGRKWPLLDASEQISGVDDENELYGYARRYLSEAAPPYTTINVELNGSIAPFVGDYKAGDWCSLILDDAWARMLLASDLEPRPDVFVRKISSYTVKVPDGVTFPETVTLDLVAEWEVDKRG